MPTINIKLIIPNKFVEETDMETIFRETDILSFHVPLTEETTFLFDQGYLKKFEKDIFLINAARARM